MILEPIANPDVLESLPTVTKTYSRSLLTDVNGEVLYQFLFNPETLKFNKSVNYSEVSVGGTAIQPMYYRNTSGTTLTLDNLLFDTYSDNRSSRELIEGLGRLTLPSTETLTPPLVIFVYGSFIFGPAILKDLRWETIAVLNGEPAVGTISINLTEVPSSTLPNAFSTRRVKLNYTAIATTDSSNSSGSSTNTVPAPTLTDRQKEEVRKKVLDYIGSNLNKFPVDIRTEYTAKRLTILIPSANEINMASGGRTLGQFGSYNIESQQLEPLAAFR